MINDSLLDFSIALKNSRYYMYCLLNMISYIILWELIDIMYVAAVTSDGNENADYDEDCDQPIPVTSDQFVSCYF